MEQRRIVWFRKALRMVDTYFCWYQDNMGDKAAVKFYKGINGSIELLSDCPSIGRLEPDYQREGLSVRSFLVHSHYRLLYGYNDERIIIIAFWDVRRINK